jgi:hypothetical protein
MRIPVTAHTSSRWRIREIAPDFRVEDVWALPAEGGADDFETLLEVMLSGGMPDSPLFRFLWWVRDQLGRWFDIGRISGPAAGRDDPGAEAALPIPGTNQTSLSERLPDDLRDTARDVRFDAVPFKALYRTNDEFAAEMSNRTVHSVMHLAWVGQGDGRFRGEMAVYVKPRGLLGTAYMALIKPFRYLIVYPALMRHIEHEWSTRSEQRTRSRRVTGIVRPCPARGAPTIGS